MIQLQMLNRILDSQDASILRINSIDSSFFSDFPTEFEFIKNHLDTYDRVPDKLTFASKFPQFDFIEVNEDANYLVDELYKDKNARHLAKIFNKVRDYINDGKISEATSLYLNAAESMVSAKHISAVDILRDKTRYDKYLERSEDFSKYYIKTGFDEIDGVIGGWDRLEELATIVATWLYLAFICKKVYKNYFYEGLISMYGMLTVTISSGVLLLRELDPEFKTPASNNLVVGSSYGIVFGAPMLILVGLAAQSTIMCFATLGIIIVYFALLLLLQSNLYLHQYNIPYHLHWLIFHNTF